VAIGPGAVIDQHQRIYGAAGLPESPMPLFADIVCANATTIMIAGRVADFMR
jgi:hypothetical protein